MELRLKMIFRKMVGGVLYSISARRVYVQADSGSPERIPNSMVGYAIVYVGHAAALKRADAYQSSLGIIGAVSFFFQAAFQHLKYAASAWMSVNAADFTRLPVNQYYFDPIILYQHVVGSRVFQESFGFP